MFRQKLGGQTAVTVMSALPNLIITLVLITFSYAIAGLVIDLMYLVIYLVIGVFKSQHLLPASVPAPWLSDRQNISLEDIALNNNIFSNGLQLIFGGNADGSGDGFVKTAASAVSEMVVTFFSKAGVVEDVLGIGANVIAYLIFAIAIFFAVTKTFFQLLMSYATFVISVIVSPFQLMVGAFTGKQDFWQWLKNLIATLAPFPVVITMIFLAMVLAGQGPPESKVGYRSGMGGNGFQAPQIGLGNDTGAIAAIQGLIAIGILMLIPEAVKLSRDWIGAKNPFEKYMGDINANLQKGWKGGQLIDGIGPKMPGAKDMLPVLGQSLGGAGAGAVLGGAGGAIGGGALAVNKAREAGGGNLSQILAGAGGVIVGGGLGAGGGAVVGAGTPVLKKIYETVSPHVEKTVKFVQKADSVAETARDFKRRSDAQRSVEQQQTPVPGATPGTGDQEQA